MGEAGWSIWEKTALDLKDVSNSTTDLLDDTGQTIPQLCSSFFWM